MLELAILFETNQRGECPFGGMAKTSSSYLSLRTWWFFGMKTRTHCENSVVRFGGKLQLIAPSADDALAVAIDRYTVDMVEITQKLIFYVVLIDRDRWAVEVEWPDGTLERVDTFGGHSLAAYPVNGGLGLGRPFSCTATVSRTRY
jgi:hypothetical protein